ncbi:uncharacterized protein AMSG_01259 [Thecamonas trahens ATCC 50062]|uniref:Uncharacterized protein n=1 Tax=Thecamonas trahens ATCC 50062 TaxID=461836 RepID=A0A0L0DQ48_THETB|nr:hypothetical protein AMSG_01259 [Thecamonas trahens ATCC 50062]KNC53548.1 hypothetical protein AMSG_01259 [Thecamonas trahens ATCC 50062]|eukprot:XP_013761867.1 hypothetical protein AMSG_01259 [Thecamonas trahens ATCC 50062]
MSEQPYEANKELASLFSVQKLLHSVQVYLVVPFIRLAYYLLRWWFGYSADALPLAFPTTRAYDVHKGRAL